MENLQEQTNKTAVRRRSQRRARDREFVSPPGERKAWALMAVGALILALVAFVSGVRMGKTLSDSQNPRGDPSAQMRGPQEIFSRLGIGGSEPQPGEDVRSLAPDAAAEQKGIHAEPAQPNGVGLKEKNKPAEEAASEKAEVKAVSPSKPRFTLQIAALNNPDEARELVNKLRAKGYPAYQITGSAAAKGTLYRVRLGQFQSLQEARQSALEFEKKEKMKTIITAVQ